MMQKCNLFVIGQFIMKHHLFRISNKAKPQAEGQGQLYKGLSDQIASLSESVQLFGRSIVRPIAAEGSGEQYIEARDRSIELEVPMIQNDLQQQRQATIKKWFASMVKTVISSSFYWYSRSEMTFSEAKIFCSQNILRNLNNLDDKWNLTGNQLKQLDRFLQQDILTYIASKYPLSESSEVSKRLQKTIKQIDNIDSIRNDYFKPSKVVFQYRESGNYNDLIMILLNDLIQGIDHRERINGGTVYAGFEEVMNDMFEKITSWDWINSGKTVTVPDNEKNKYRQNVKEYTSYAIGRKFSENTVTYSQNQIESLHLRIRSPQILRILTKWCEELWNKLSVPNFYTDGLGQCSLQDGKIVNLSADHRNYLDNCIEQERAKIMEELRQLKLNNYQLQSEILKLRSLSEEYQVEQNQAACGKFSVKVMRNLHVYLVTYLNRLIHALTGISLRLHQYLQLESTRGWQKPPNLITLRLGDLMRCRCSSKQMQIIRLYEQLEKISRENPELLKIIRVKNRLRKGTNDILINVRFKDTYLCEIQLSIKSKVTDTAKRYNQYAHFLYELQRTMFGPITEVCSIWASLDSRIEIYNKLLGKEKVEPPIPEHACQKLRNSFQQIAYSNPFICSLCGCHYSHDNFIFHPLKCTTCSFFKCCKCQIESDSESEMLAKLANKNKLLEFCRERVRLEDYFPTFGICIQIESKVVKPQPFQLIYDSRRTYLLAEDKGTIYQLQQIDSQKGKARFFEKYLIMGAYKDANCSFWDVGRDELVKRYVLREKVRQNYIKQKESINLEDRWLQAKDCAYILQSGDIFQRRSIANLFLNKNTIQDIGFLPNLFQNLRWIQLDNNQFTSLDPICQCTSLLKLSASSCKIESIPESFDQLVNLEQLQLAHNQITRLTKALNLYRLRIANLEGNRIQSIDDGYFEGNPVQSLNLSRNRIEAVPDSLGKLSKLYQLLMANNTIKTIPETISSILGLSVLDLSNNQLSELPHCVCWLKQLKILKLSFNKIEKVSGKVGEMQNLKQLYLQENKIEYLAESLGTLKDVIIIDLCANLFSQFPLQVTKLASLKGLKANNNNFIFLPSEFTKLSNLNYFELISCQLKTIQFDHFSPLSKLRSVNLSSNQLQRVPSFKDCSEIVEINLQFNQITELGEDCLQGLLKLQKLIMTFNQLTIFPPIGIQPNLRQLKLDSNKIIQFKGCESISLPNLKLFSLNGNDHPNIPPFLFNCPKIQSIQLSSNQIQTIPTLIGQIPSLKQLHLACNNISTIPPQMKKLINIENINLATNNIEIIPDYFDQLPKLRLFCLLNNKITEYNCDRQTIYKMDDETRRIFFQNVSD